MCGIVGLWHWNDRGDEYPRMMRDMLARIRHRGPDEMGYYFDDRVALGAARLSIIDLVGGQQPMLDSGGRFCLVYNGEIYNYVELRRTLESLGHRFESRSDTEVLLRAWMHWGSDALPRLNGMFAFAIYDRRTDTVTLARDRFGERPLYYRHRNGRLAFASELKAFLAVDDFDFSMDEGTLTSIYRVWVPLPHATGFRDIEQVPPGSFVTFSAGRHEHQRHFELALDQRAHAEIGTAVEQTRAHLESSVRLRLRSDVEVATYLSGGIDSAVITALAVKNSSRQIRTFSLGFEEAEFDEEPAQRVMQEHLGTNHRRIVISNSDIATAFPDAVRHAEVPVFRTALAPMYLLSRAVHEEGIKVVLSGEGADEVFLGYDIFKEAKLRALADASPEETLRLVAALYPHELHLHGGQASPLSALFAQFADRIDDPLFSHHLRFHNSSFTTRLLPHAPDDSLQQLREWMSSEIPAGSNWPVIARAQWLEFRTLLAGYLLSSQGDRASMAHSVEVRSPFLDVHVVESASRLPMDFLLHPSGEEKHVLRAAFADLLPASIAVRGKQPYRSPDAKVFQDTRPDYVESILSEAELQSMGIFDARFAAKLANKVMNAAGPVSPRESQTFVFLLSTALVYRFFCGRDGVAAEPIDHLFRTTIDGRQSSAG